MNEQVYLILHTIKQGLSEVVKECCEQILKLENCLQHKVDDHMLATFYRVGLLPYFYIAIVSMKWDTPIEHKESMVFFEENLMDANGNKVIADSYLVVRS